MAGERAREALKKYRRRYRQAAREGKSRVLDEFCSWTSYHCKYAIALLGRPDDERAPSRRRRGPTYSAQVVRVLEAIWRRSGYPWSRRLMANRPASIAGVSPTICLRAQGSHWGNMVNPWRFRSRTIWRIRRAL